MYGVAARTVVFLNYSAMTFPRPRGQRGAHVFGDGCGIDCAVHELAAELADVVNCTVLRGPARLIRGTYWTVNMPRETPNLPT